MRWIVYVAATCAVALVLLPQVGWAAAGTAYFALAGDAPESAKETVLAAIREAIESSGGSASDVGAPIDDTLVVLGCSLTETRCRADVAAALGAGEMLYGALEPASGGYRLTLTLVDDSGAVRGNADVVLSAADLSAARASVSDLLRGDVVAPAIPDVAPPKRVRRRARGFAAAGVILTVAGLGVTGAGIGLGISLRSLQRDFEEGLDTLPLAKDAGADDVNSLQELEALAARGRTRAMLTNIAYAVGGATLGVGVILSVVALARGRRGAGTVSVKTGLVAGGVGGTVEVTW